MPNTEAAYQAFLRAVEARGQNENMGVAERHHQIAVELRDAAAAHGADPDDVMDWLITELIGIAQRNQLDDHDTLVVAAVAAWRSVRAQARQEGRSK